MHLSLEQALKKYTPWNEQEERDRAVMLNALSASPDPFTRENPVMHFTASSWILSPDGRQVLMAYHNIYQSWAWTGGHADGEADLLAVALREAREETGIGSIRPVTQGIYSLEILPVFAHVKRGQVVSAHLHLNLTYLLTADDTLPIRPKPDENSAVAWLPLEEAADNRDEPHMAVIYRKLNEKLRKS